MSSTSENHEVDGAASCPTGASSDEGVIIVVMGVSGSGKTTLGAALAKALSLPFIDADDLHSEANKVKMTRGEALTDADRAPWLVGVRRAAVDAVECSARGVVVACSALKAAYRQVLRGERADLNPDASYSRGDACREATVTARNEYLNGGQLMEHRGGGLEGRHRLGRDKGIMVGVSPARRAPPLRTVFVHPFGAERVLMERMMSREGHFMKASMLASQMKTLENPVDRGEIGIIEIRLEGSEEEQVRASVLGLARLGVREVLPNM